MSKKILQFFCFLMITILLLKATVPFIMEENKETVLAVCCENEEEKENKDNGTEKKLLDEIIVHHSVVPIKECAPIKKIPANDDCYAFVCSDIQTPPPDFSA